MNDRYPKEWSHVPSVTEVLDTISKPALIYWLKNNSAQAIKEASEKSLDIGSTVHEIIDKVENGIKVEIETKYPDEVKSCLKAYFEWKKSKSLTFLQSELKMISTNLGYKGTLDRLCRSSDGLELIDWKTSKKIYEDMIFQVVAYKRLYEDTVGERISKCWIIRLPKDGTEFEPYEVNLEHENLYFEIFNHALQGLLLRNKVKRLTGGVKNANDNGRHDGRRLQRQRGNSGGLVQSQRNGAA